MRIHTLTLVLVVSLSFTAEDDPALSAITEIRNGHIGVYGVRASLFWARLASLKDLERVIISEKKSGKQLTPGMQVSVTADLGTIMARFHDGFGDVGTGNIVVMTIPAAALREPFNRGDLVLEVEAVPQRPADKP